MKKELIEIYSHTGEGYNPFFIKDNWQVAQLNYMPELGIFSIDKLEKHVQTDEIIIVEKSNTHLGDVVYKSLNTKEKSALDKQIQNSLNHKA